MSGIEPPIPTVVLPAALYPVVATLELLTAVDMPAIAVIGGMAVNIRVSTVDEAHRATQDIDLVANDQTPTAIEVLSRGRNATREHTVVVNGFDVDVIDTHPVSERDLDTLDDDAKLFVAGHRWALDTARPVWVTAVGGDRSVEVAVATPAGLIATKSHAVGYPRAARRATRHGSDLYDLFRLVEVFDTAGELRAEIADAPFTLGSLIAAVMRAEILANPARAMRQMTAAASTVLDIDRILDVIEPFIA